MKRKCDQIKKIIHEGIKELIKKKWETKKIYKMKYIGKEKRTDKREKLIEMKNN